MAEIGKTTVPGTAMAAAFMAAGFEPQETLVDKLRRLMATAITKEGPGRGLSEPSLRRFKSAVLAEEDPALVWFLFDKMGGPLRLFWEVLAEIRSGKEFRWGDHTDRETHSGSESSSEGAAAETMPSVEPIPRLSRAAALATDTQPRTHAPPGHGINGMQVIMHWGAQNWLRRFTVGNKPVAAMTLRELEEAVAGRGRDCRFLTLLRDMWPKYTSDGVVSDYVTDEEGDRLYAKAKETPDV